MSIYLLTKNFMSQNHGDELTTNYIFNLIIQYIYATITIIIKILFDDLTD